MSFRVDGIRLGFKSYYLGIGRGIFHRDEDYSEGSFS